MPLRLVRAALAFALAALPAAVCTVIAVSPFTAEHVAHEGPQSQGAVGIAAAALMVAPILLVLCVLAALIAWRKPALRPAWRVVFVLVATPPLVAFIVRAVQHLARL